MTPGTLATEWKVKADSHSCMISLHRLHPQNRSNWSCGQDGRGHLILHPAGLAHLLRPEAGDHRESRVDMSTGALQSSRRTAQAGHRADETTQGGDALRVVVSQITMLFWHCSDELMQGGPTLGCGVGDKSTVLTMCWHRDTEWISTLCLRRRWSSWQHIDRSMHGEECLFVTDILWTGQCFCYSVREKVWLHFVIHKEDIPFWWGRAVKQKYVNACVL